MSKQTVPALISCLLILAMSACKGNTAGEPAVNAASSVQPAIAAGPSPVNEQLDIQWDNNNGRYEAFPAKIVSGSTVTWTFTSQFQVVFNKTAPCSNADTPGGTTLTSSASSPFQVVCNVNRAADRSKDKYNITLYPPLVTPQAVKPAKKKQFPVPVTGDHCEGCIIDN